MLAVVAAVSVASGQTHSRHSANRSNMDDPFVTRAAQGGMADVQMAQLALEKSSNPAVKDLAKTIHDDHTVANTRLQSVAANNGMTWPTALSAQQLAEYKKLQGLSGEAFDREYISYQVRDHKKDIAEFEREAQKGTNADTRTWAAETLPTLRKHLSMGQKVQSQLQ
jgi:putative membrane protein